MSPAEQAALPSIRLRFEALISALTLIGGLAYLLGWLKSLYFYQTLGVNLEMAALSVQDYLFESWFVVETVVLTLLLWWVVLVTRSRWGVVVAVLHALIPLGSHYAFAVASSPPAAFLIHYRHTLLKWIPFVVVLASLLHRPLRERLRDLSWPHGTAALALFTLTALAWSVSAAKHLGSFDACRALLHPASYFAAVECRTDAGPVTGKHTPRPYLLRSTPEGFILLDFRPLPGRLPGPVEILFVPRDQVRSIAGAKAPELQPGGQFF